MINLAAQDIYARTNIIVTSLLGMLALLGIGTQMTFQGIINTRKGEEKDVHSKKKLLQHIVLAVVISGSFALFVGMIIAFA